MSNSLTRAQRRRIQRHVGSEKAEEVVETLKGPIIDMTIDYYSLALAHVMVHKLNYGGKKVNTVLKQIEEVCDLLARNELDYEDIRKDLKENYDVTISKDTVHRIGGTR